MFKSQIIFFLSFGSNTLLDTTVSKIICFKNYTLFRKSYDLATIVYFAKDIYYVIKFVLDLRQVGGFLQVLCFPPPIKLTATI